MKIQPMLSPLYFMGTKKEEKPVEEATLKDRVIPTKKGVVTTEDGTTIERDGNRVIVHGGGYSAYTPLLKIKASSPEQREKMRAAWGKVKGTPAGKKILDTWV